MYNPQDLSKTTIINDIDHDIVKHGKIVSVSIFCPTRSDENY